MVTRPRGGPSGSRSRSSLVLALAKQAQMAWFRSRRSPYQGGMIVSGVMSASWAVPMLPSGSGSGGQAGSGVPSGR